MVDIEQIIGECKRYNKFAQKILYDMYAFKMKGICLRYVNDNETAKDILQEGFIKVFSNIRQFNGNGSFEGWMKRIFINTAISHLRKNNKDQNKINIEIIDESKLHEYNVHDIIENTSEDLRINNYGRPNFELVQMADLSEAELLNALHKIPEKYRIVFNLSCIENKKHEEIADILDIDITTSRTRLLRARDIIKKEIFSICLEKLKK